MGLTQQGHRDYQGHLYLVAVIEGERVVYHTTPQDHLNLLTKNDTGAPRLVEQDAAVEQICSNIAITLKGHLDPREIVLQIDWKTGNVISLSTS